MRTDQAKIQAAVWLKVPLCYNTETHSDQGTQHSHTVPLIKHGPQQHMSHLEGNRTILSCAKQTETMLWVE